MVKEAEESWLDSIDIGIMPLEDDEWSRGKCAFKLLQYMAHGKPVVASKVGANTKAVIHGISGILADTEEEWAKAFEVLILNQNNVKYGPGKPPTLSGNIRTAAGSRTDGNHPARSFPANENSPFTLTRPD